MDTDRIESKQKQAEGELQETWGKAKDKARDVWDDVKEAFDDDSDKEGKDEKRREAASRRTA